MARVIVSVSSAINLDRLYDDHAQGLFAFLLNFLRNEADCHDVLQEVFVKIARRPTILSNVRDERAFLVRLAGNLAIDHIRRRGTHERNDNKWSEDTGSIFAESAHPDEEGFRQALTLALGVLPPEQRAVVHLKLWEGQTFETIADSLNISSNTAASRYRYGIDKLRERLRPIYEEIK